VLSAAGDSQPPRRLEDLSEDDFDSDVDSEAEKLAEALEEQIRSGPCFEHAVLVACNEGVSAWKYMS
jgi:hypothetical protein